MKYVRQSTSNLDINSGELIYISTIKLEGNYNIKGGLNSNEKYFSEVFNKIKCAKYT